MPWAEIRSERLAVLAEDLPIDRSSLDPWVVRVVAGLHSRGQEQAIDVLSHLNSLQTHMRSEMAVGLVLARWPNSR